jgi:cytochrome P450
VISKVHIVMSPDVAQSALRNRSLSFDSFSMAFAKRVLGATSENFLAQSYTPKNDKEECFNNEMHKVYHEPLQPGPALQETNGVMLREVARFMNKIGTEYERKELYGWLRDSFTVATTIALFGSQNTFVSDPTLTDALWYPCPSPHPLALPLPLPPTPQSLPKHFRTNQILNPRDFEAGIQMLMLNLLPFLTCPSAHRGRSKLQAAGRSFYAAGRDRDDDLSTFIKRRIFIHRKYGFTNDEMGEYDLAMMLVATTNAILTLFWMVVDVLSSPGLIDTLRAEVSGVMTTSADPETGETRRVIDTARFVAECPVLCAAYQESMRLSNKQMSIRVAEEDTTVSSASQTYLLKKGTVVLLPSSLHHTAPEVWGENAEVFEPGRWLKESFATTSAVAGQGDGKAGDAKEAKEAERLQKKAFFPFGGGRHLCPGRHFAFAEILGMVALLVTGYEVVMADDAVAGNGPLRMPEREYRFFGEAVPKPVGKYDVLIRRRKGFEGVKWAFST